MNMKKPHSANRHNGGKPRHGRKFSHRPYQGGDGSGNRGGGGGGKNAVAARDKYLAMARDASASGDRILAEYYLQHADHYTRQVNENASRWQATPQEGQSQQERPPEHSQEHSQEHPQEHSHERAEHTRDNYGNGNANGNGHEPVSGNYASYDEEPAAEPAAARPRTDSASGLPAFITRED